MDPAYAAPVAPAESTAPAEPTAPAAPLSPGEHGIGRDRLESLGLGGLMERGITRAGFVFAGAGQPVPGASSSAPVPLSSDHGVFVLFRGLPRDVSGAGKLGFLGFLAYQGPDGEPLAVHTGTYDATVTRSADGTFDVLLTRTDPPVRPWESSDSPPIQRQLLQQQQQQQQQSRKRPLSPPRSVAFPRWTPSPSDSTTHRSFLLIVGPLRPPDEGDSEASWGPVDGAASRDLLARALARIPPSERVFVDRNPFGEMGRIRAKVLVDGRLAEMRLFLEGFECELRGETLVVRYETREIDGGPAYAAIAPGEASDADGDCDGAPDADDASDGGGDAPGDEVEDVAESCSDDSDNGEGRNDDLSEVDSNGDAEELDDAELDDAGATETEVVWCTGTIFYRSPDSAAPARPPSGAAESSDPSPEDVWGEEATESLQTQVRKIAEGLLGPRVEFEVDALHEPADFADEKCVCPAAFVVRARAPRSTRLFRGTPF